MRLVIAQLMIHEVLVEHLDEFGEYDLLHERGFGNLATYSIGTRLLEPLTIQLLALADNCR